MDVYPCLVKGNEGVESWAMDKLVLFDIDGTLLSVHGAGMRAMEKAGKVLYGDGFCLKDVEAAGQLDPDLFAVGARRAGIESGGENLERFKELFGEFLVDELAHEDAVIKVMPGIDLLVKDLHERDDVVIGLLTGNYTHTGPIKLRAAGIDPELFSINSFGDDGETRPALVGVAMARYEAVHGRTLRGDDVVVIGDTPRDVECAKVNGCYSVGVGTGFFSVEELLDEGADVALEDLTDAGAIYGLLGLEMVR